MYKQRENQQMMTIYFDKPFYQEVQKFARHKGLSLSSFVRLTIREEIDRQQEKRNERQPA